MTEDAMSTTARFVMERALLVERAFNKTGFGFNATMAQVNGTGRNNATSLLIKKLVFAQSKSVRTSTIILAVFNVLAALATATSILYDSYMATRRCNPKFKATKFCVKRIHPAEIFPLLLATGIVIQGLAFIGVQSTGLTSLFTRGCTVVAQVLWPALFIVPYIQLVFGLEFAFRSLRSQPFQPQGRYTVPILGVIISLMLLGTWLMSRFIPERNVCFASLFWWLTRYGELGLIMFSVIATVMLISALTIFVRLSKFNFIDEHQRIAASRMVYYLVLGIISMAFVIPWFVSLTTGNGDMKAAMMASVVVNLSGLISGLLQLFLRANTVTTSFGPVGSRDHKKHQIRLFGPNELVYNNPIMSPLSAPHTPLGELPTQSASRAQLVGDEKTGRPISMGSLVSVYSKPSPTSRFNQQAFPSQPKLEEPMGLEAGTYRPTTPRVQAQGRKQSYSLFPVEAPSLDNNLLSVKPRQEPTSIYDISDLAAPPPIFSGRGHRRDSSLASTATVQIGLRLSRTVCPNAATTPLPLAPTTYKPNVSKPTPPTPLKLKTQGIPLPNSPKPQANSMSPKLSSPKLTSPRSSPGMNKTLPPTPHSEHNKLVSEVVGDCEVCQLSPAVYTPEKSLPSVGLPSQPKPTAPSASQPKAASPSQGPLRGNPLDSPKKTTPQKGKSEWI
ncbi:hypothetical protein BJ875DRAFT_59285 [Amylocarpus encephaloides]|uniref:Uncharacterized protein n=1 Tax=Amylocarpus encephaloides TaxID=45428 RepID=A0A9P7YH95_9HELO|nr:hypothetical protein BJ875DRAFT_59285 [Amylocarpus encephaloides]